MTTPSRALPWITAAAMALALPAAAHDYWLRPARFAVAPGDVVPVTLWVGDGFHTESERALQRDRTVRFVRVRTGGTDDLMPGALEGARPVATVQFDTPGGHLVAMERNPIGITLEPARFNAYLADEGLTGPLAERTRRGLLGTPGRERYVRGVKALVQCGAVHDRVYATVLGLPLEIVPLEDPSTRRPGDRLPFRVLYAGRPLAGVTVDALGERGTAVTALRAVTDVHGEAAVRLPHAGAWLLRAVHMVPCAGCTDADWSSAWTSYAFGI